MPIGPHSSNESIAAANDANKRISILPAADLLDVALDVALGVAAEPVEVAPADCVEPELTEFVGDFVGLIDEDVPVPAEVDVTTSVVVVGATFDVEVETEVLVDVPVVSPTTEPAPPVM